MTDEAASVYVHANALLIGEAGVLLRGPSGSGKSALTLDLIDYAQSRGTFAALVADDRAGLCARHGRLVARPHPAIAGRIEVRGRGIVSAPFEPAAVIRLIVDLSPGDVIIPRLPDEEEAEATLCGVTLPLLCEGGAETRAARRIVAYLRALMTK